MKDEKHKQKLTDNELNIMLSEVSKEITKLKKDYTLGKRTGRSTAIIRFLRLHFKFILKSDVYNTKKGKHYDFQKFITLHIRKAYLMGRIIEKRKLWEKHCRK